MSGTLVFSHQKRKNQKEKILGKNNLLFLFFMYTEDIFK
jgi:hypothetical protein